MLSRSAPGRFGNTPAQYLKQDARARKFGQRLFTVSWRQSPRRLERMQRGMRQFEPFKRHLALNIARIRIACRILLRQTMRGKTRVFAMLVGLGMTRLGNGHDRPRWRYGVEYNPSAGAILIKTDHCKIRHAGHSKPVTAVERAASWRCRRSTARPLRAASNPENGLDAGHNEHGADRGQYDTHSTDEDGF